ncbi:cupin domain-containing protein [Roseivirga sp. E12]|uniref:cupin domain-containing protein n=1 Tax=Roseivirga sp. E12 TaxID=2819237 RepID=UPI001ABC30D6|nr:cupin domain-containing protein [Roseivirga sp. E12]MBO3698244.1 cupin domain-containing protein [Roseivirga sp. E12]
MEIASILKEVSFKEKGPAIKVLFDTPFTKEIRIAMRKGQLMKEHQTPFPIVIQLVEGAIDFTVSGKVLNLEKGDLIVLEGAIPHSLIAHEESIVRLTLTKADQASRVKQVVEN